MKTKFTSGLLTQRLLQWVSCMGSLIQCHTNGAMELLLQLSGTAVVVVGTDTQLAVKVAACVLWKLRYRRLVDRSRHCTVVILSDSYWKPISMSSVMFNQQMHKSLLPLIYFLKHSHMSQYPSIFFTELFICCNYLPSKMKLLLYVDFNNRFYFNWLVTIAYEQLPAEDTWVSEHVGVL